MLKPIRLMMAGINASIIVLCGPLIEAIITHCTSSLCACYSEREII